MAYKEVTDRLGGQLHTGRGQCHHSVLGLYRQEETLPVCQEEGDPDQENY